MAISKKTIDGVTYWYVEKPTSQLTLRTGSKYIQYDTLIVPPAMEDYGYTAKAAATYYPSTSAQTIAANQYLTGAQTIAATTPITNSTYAGYLTSSTTARTTTIKTIAGPTSDDIYIYPSTSIYNYWASSYGLKISKPGAAGITVSGGGLSQDTASGGGLSGGGLSGGGLTAGAGEVSITQNPEVTPSVGGTGTASAAQTNYGVTTTKPSGTDGTNFLTFDPGATVNKEAKAKGRGTVSRAAVTRAKVTRAAFSQTVNRAAVTDTRTAGYLAARSSTTIVDAGSSTVSLAEGSIAADSTTIGETSATSNYSSESSSSTTVNGGTNWYVPIVTASATGGTASASASIAKNPSASASASQTGMTAGISSSATSYYFTSSASAASGYSTASASATGGSASVGKGITAGASASGAASGNKSATSTEKTASDSSTIYLKAATCTVAGGGLSQGTASGGGLSGGGLSGGGLSGAGDVGIDIYEVASGSQDANITLSCVDIGSKDTTNYPYYFKVAAAGTTKTITRAQINRAKIDRAAFSQTVSRAAVTDTHTAGYLPAQSVTTVIAADSSTVSLAAGSIAADSIASTTASVTAAEKVEYVKMKSAGISRSGNTVSWSEGYTGSGSSTGATTSASRSGNKVSWGTGWITEGSSTGDTTSRSKGDGYISPISGVTLSTYLTTTSSDGVGGFYGSGSVSTDAGWVVAGSTTSNASSTYYIKKGSVSRSGNTVTWTTGWVTGDSSTGATTSRSASTGTLTAISGVTLSDYLTTTSSSGVGGFYGYGAVSTGEGWVSSGSTNSNASSTYYIKKGSATTPTASGASTSTSLSGTTLTVSRSVTPTISAGWVTSGTAGTVTITGTVPTETKSVDPSTSAQTVTHSSGKLLSSVSVSAIQTETTTVYPSSTTQTVYPTSGKFFSSVTVNAMPTQYIQFVCPVTNNFQATISSLSTSGTTMYYRTLSDSASYGGRTFYKLGSFALNNKGAFFNTGLPLANSTPYFLCTGNVKYATSQGSTTHTTASFTLYAVKDSDTLWILSTSSTLYPGGSVFNTPIIMPGARSFSSASFSRPSRTAYKEMYCAKVVTYNANDNFVLPDTVTQTATSGIMLTGYCLPPTSTIQTLTLGGTFTYHTFNTGQPQIELRLYSSAGTTAYASYFIPKGEFAGDIADDGQAREYKNLSNYYLKNNPTVGESTQSGKVGFSNGSGVDYLAHYKSNNAVVTTSDVWSDDIISIYMA